MAGGRYYSAIDDSCIIQADDGSLLVAHRAIWLLSSNYVALGVKWKSTSVGDATGFIGTPLRRDAGGTHFRTQPDIAQGPKSANSRLMRDERSDASSSACEIYAYPRARSRSRSLSGVCGRARPAPLRLLYVAIAIAIHVAWNAIPANRTN